MGPVYVPDVCIRLEGKARGYDKRSGHHRYDIRGFPRLFDPRLSFRWRLGMNVYG